MVMPGRIAPRQLGQVDGRRARLVWVASASRLGRGHGVASASQVGQSLRAPNRV